MAGKEKEEFFMDGDEDGMEVDSQDEDLEDNRSEDGSHSRGDEEGDEDAADGHGAASFSSQQWPQSYRYYRFPMFELVNALALII